MAIDFSPQRWDKVARTMQAWWDGTLGRPVASAHLIGRDPGRGKPSGYILNQQTCLDFSVSADDVIDRVDYELSRRVILGDGFPHLSLESFGAGVLAAFLGARMDNSISGVWFHSPGDIPIADMHFAYDPGHPVFLRIMDLCRAAVRRWSGQVQIGMTDLGGVMDVLASFRTTEKLLVDLYDSPDEVLRCASEIEKAWGQYYDAIQSIISPVNPGYSDWLGLFSPIPSYTTQCDFSYMISPEMFTRFVLPELSRTWNRLGHGVYHLDGIGELPHLPYLVADPALHVIQWVPGDGKPIEDQWPKVYRDIHAGGKKILMMHLPCLPTIIEQIGANTDVMCWNNYAVPMEKGEAAKELLRKVGVPV